MNRHHFEIFFSQLRGKKNDMEWHTATPSKAGIISCCVNSPKLNSCHCGHIDSWNKQHRAAGPLPTTPPRLPTLRPQFRTRSVAAPMVFIESKETHHANLAWRYDFNIQIFLRFHVLEALFVCEGPYIIKYNTIRLDSMIKRYETCMIPTESIYKLPKKNCLTSMTLDMLWVNNGTPLLGSLPTVWMLDIGWSSCRTLLVNENWSLTVPKIFEKFIWCTFLSWVWSTYASDFRVNWSYFLEVLSQMIVSSQLTSLKAWG